MDDQVAVLQCVGDVEDEAISLNLLPVGTSSAAAPCEDEGDRKVRFGPWGPKKGAL